MLVLLLNDLCVLCTASQRYTGIVQCGIIPVHVVSRLSQSSHLTLTHQFTQNRDPDGSKASYSKETDATHHLSTQQEEGRVRLSYHRQPNAFDFSRIAYHELPGTTGRIRSSVTSVARSMRSIDLSRNGGKTNMFDARFEMSDDDDDDDHNAHSGGGDVAQSTTFTNRADHFWVKFPSDTMEHSQEDGVSSVSESSSDGSVSVSASSASTDKSEEKDEPVSTDLALVSFNKPTNNWTTELSNIQNNNSSDDNGGTTENNTDGNTNHSMSFGQYFVVQKTEGETVSDLGSNTEQGTRGVTSTAPTEEEQGATAAAGSRAVVATTTTGVDRAGTHPPALDDELATYEV